MSVILHSNNNPDNYRIPHNRVGGPDDIPDLPLDYENCQRTGVIAAFNTLEEFEKYSDELLDVLDDMSGGRCLSPGVLDAVEHSESRLSTSINISTSFGEHILADRIDPKVIYLCFFICREVEFCMG
jgi:hypothetical protein